MSEIYRVFNQHKDALRRVIRRHSGPGQDPDELLQESFMRAFAAELKRRVENPRAFLFQVARNTALAELRRFKNGPIDETADFSESVLLAEGASDDTAEVVDSRRKLRVFTEAVAQLPPKCRQAFLLRRVDGLSFKQIANRMDISVSAAEKHVALGLTRCHAFMQRAGYSPSEIGARSAGEADRAESKGRKRERT
ncbi:MAG: RNA polymerase sigma factor [Pseudomonadota bacterium]